MARGAGLRMRLAGLVLVALAAGAVALAAERHGGEGPRAKPVAFASGAIASNSRDGQAILSASNLRPGDSVQGQVTIANQGDGPGEFTLLQRLRSEAAGPGGGRLFDRLTVEVRGTGGAGGLVYSGPMSALAAAPLGRFEQGDSRTYSFVVSFPSGSGDDAFQAASVSVDYEWTTDAAPARKGCRYGIVGTSGPDMISGTGRDDVIRGRAGDDAIQGLGGPDCLFGGHGDDGLPGGRGADRIRGGYGDDELRGGRADDVLRGRQGDDLVIGGRGRDRLRGTSGDDLIIARDGEVDNVRCGIGEDEAIVDPLDITRGCERLR